MAIPSQSHSAPDSSFTAIQRKLGCSWNNIVKAADAALQKRNEFLGAVEQGDSRFWSHDWSLVVFGSLARDEYTAGSDADWTVLVDAPVASAHVTAAHAVSSRTKKAFRSPGRTGVFGTMAFSHEVVHQIGGHQDSNANTTRRILLLLESACIGRPDAYDRVIRGLLNRYLEEDRTFSNPEGEPPKVPRFLLNDIVRYWRTMAVDFASKHRERAGEGWALRNAKLRLSRKLIFASGMLMCFSCKLSPSNEARESLFGPELTFEPLINHLDRYVRSTPLEILATMWLEYGPENAMREFFDSYDAFLGMLNDTTSRERLENLPEATSRTDELFQRIRNQGHRFDRALLTLFFEVAPIADLTKRFGVF